MMKISKAIVLLSAFVLLASSCEKKEKESPYKGILLNEIAAHDDAEDIDTWG